MIQKILLLINCKCNFYDIKVGKQTSKGNNKNDSINRLNFLKMDILIKNNIHIFGLLVKNTKSKINIIIYKVEE